MSDRSRLLFLAFFALTADSVLAQSPAQLPRAARDLERGTTLVRTDIDAPVAIADSLTGWVARRRIRAGEVLRTPAVGRPEVVTRGAAVEVHSLVAGVSVTRPGSAVTAGALGERIRVRLDATRVVHGTVTGPSTVTVP